MASNLDSYREKRNFSATPEPSGEAGESDAERTDRFVVQEHHARALHWDLRLERDGVLASWAVPKGIPATPERNHLAVHTEDHPLEYGGGQMGIWDAGTYELHKWQEREVIVTLHGRRVDGKYVLFKTGGKNW